MTNTLTETALNDFATRMTEAADRLDWDTYDQLAEEIGTYAGTGEPTDETKADELTTDYHCALDDGRIVFWGADQTAPGRTFRIPEIAA